IVFDIATLSWKKRRANLFLQLALLQSPFVDGVENSGKQTVKGIRDHLDFKRSKERRNRGKRANAVAEFSETMVTLEETMHAADYSLGKVGSNLRHAIGEFKKAQPLLDDQTKLEEDSRRYDFAPGIDLLNKAIDLESRLNFQIDKAIKRLVMAKEFRRQ